MDNEHQDNFPSHDLVEKVVTGNSLTPEPPIMVIIDPINSCNLNCVLCASKFQNYPKSKMALKTFTTILDKLPSTNIINLFNWGESLLHNEIIDFIKDATSRNIQTYIHSNFSFLKPDSFFVDLIQSGLDMLTISLDGASQATYEQYRRKGNFNLVIDNIRTLVKVKKELNSDSPMIVWKFLVNKFNETEMTTVEEMAEKLDVALMFCNMGLSEDLPDLDFSSVGGTIEARKEKWLPENENYIEENLKPGRMIYPKFKKPCNYLFTTMIINPDGKVFPCSRTTNIENVFGDLTKESFEDIWYGEKYQYARSLFCNEPYMGKKFDIICNRCKLFIKNIENPLTDNQNLQS